MSTHAQPVGGTNIERPRSWRLWSPAALCGYWLLQLALLLTGAVLALGYAMPGTTVDLGSGMPVAMPASAVVLIPTGTAVLVLIRTERIRTADVTRDAAGITIRPARRLRLFAWFGIGAVLLGLVGPIALLASYWSTSGPVAAAAFGWAAGCGFVAWPAVSGTRKVLRGVAADDLLQLSSHELVWRSQGYERRVRWSDVVSVEPSTGGSDHAPCIRIGVGGASDNLLLPWRFLTAGPMQVLRASGDHRHHQ